jgi:N-acetylglucosamine-6-sulfatase
MPFIVPNSFDAARLSRRRRVPGAMGKLRASVGGLLAALVAGIALAEAGREPEPAAAQQAEPRPNVVVIMSDDQTEDSMRYMPRTRSLVGGRGATFKTSVTNWPLCCPSRATFLTGQYAHNHGVLGNQAPNGGFGRLRADETLPVWLRRAGYFTAHVGKFLNGYERSPVGVPPGWSEWHGSKRTYLFYGYQLFENGAAQIYGSTNEDPDDPAEPGTYSGDVYTDKAVELIQRRAPDEQPFFLSLAYLAPHSGGPNPDAPNQSRCQWTAKPAPRHIGAFDSEPLPTPPSFNEADVSDKPAGLASRAPLTGEELGRITRRYRCRAESLLAIDEGVERVISTLRATGELDDTLVVYTSDNGFFHGEHRIANGKNRVYEEAIRVPLLMRGPGIPKGVAVAEPAINADLAPTIVDAANAQAGVAMDGRSLLGPAAHPRRLSGRELLIEQDNGIDDDDNVNGVFYGAVRNARYTYVANRSGEIELYDLDADPFQLINRAGDPAYAEAQAALAARLAGLAACAGKSCRTKPSLRLKLPRSVREGGRSCRPPGGFITKLKGKGARGVVGAVFSVGRKRAGADSSAPLRKRIAKRLLRGKRRPRISAEVEFVDGRRMTLEKRPRICR